MKRWMIYGASGYTGELVCELAHRHHFHPILAGRNEEKIRHLAEKYNFDYRIFDLNNSKIITDNLSDIEVLLNCAGPFIDTHEQLVRGALKTHTHYLDITGEIAVFEKLHELDNEAKTAKIILLPGVGFDVVPTDCLAKELSLGLPGAESLQLAFYSLGGQFSRGTLRTALLGLSEGLLVRRGGKIVKLPPYSETLLLPHPYYSRKNLELFAVSWGDVSTAFYSTQIREITTYTHMNKNLVSLGLKPGAKLLPILSKNKNFTEKLLNLVPLGPDKNVRTSAKMWVWGRVSKGAQKIEKSIEVPEGYSFTAMSALYCVKKALELKEQGALGSGFFTPSLLLGPGLTQEILDFHNKY